MLKDIENKIPDLIENLRKKHFNVINVNDIEKAKEEVLKLINENETVGVGGSLTIRALGVIEELMNRGNKVIHHWLPKTFIDEIKKAFKDKEIGCITGKPVSINNRNTKYGYWASLLFSGIDKVRKKKSEKKEFFECSGYLFAIRKGIIFDFPLEVSEDSIIPYLFWKKGYKIKYLDNVEVYVKNPENWKDWCTQKIRNIKGHENLNKIAKDMPRTKSFFNEIIYGTFFAISYPRNFKEFFWTIELFFARAYIYFKAFSELKNKSYSDGWREVETKSTSPFD